MSTLFRVLLLSIFSLPVVAETEERWFSIEVIVFERVKNNAHLEHWPVPQNLAFPQPRLFFPSDSNALSAPAIQEMEFGGPLSDALKKLNASSAYRVLAARQWKQALLPKKQAPHLVFKGGQSFGGRYELEGSLQFSVERYLHLNTNLWFTTFAAEGEVADSYVTPTSMQATMGDTFENDETVDEPFDEVAPSWSLPAMPEPPIISLPDQTEDNYTDQRIDDGQQETFAETMQESTSDNEVADELSTDIVPTWPIERIVTLQQQRRLRSTETHYIDHPLFGMLVHILPQEEAPAGDEEDDIL